MTDYESLSTVHALVIDMDGVLWRGETPLPGLNAFFDLLQERDIRFILATNNASKTPEQYLGKLKRFGVDIERDKILTSSLVTAAYLQAQLPPGAPVHVLGEEGLRRAVEEAGFALRQDHEGPVEAVVVGIDFSLTYEKLKRATLFIRAGARFIGTNPDRTLPIEGGLAPGTGAILVALETATDVKPTVIGKPGPIMFQHALQQMQANLVHTAMLGDRLETDIAGGHSAGMRTILVLSGASRREDLARARVQPTWIFSHIEELTRKWASSS